jgi:hypothetical protein
MVTPVARREAVAHLKERFESRSRWFMPLATNSITTPSCSVTFFY